MVHLLGFCGSAFFILAVTMRSVIWLRSFALAGSFAFVAYGAVLAVWPVVLTNVVTAAIHLIQLRALVRIGTPMPSRAVVVQRS